ncbi:hypothetical protein BDW74DRAFT_48977 [Aspergillus multicolor]|uniref:uncharacterized protein n=1 Tax=Aspergillus multicolor TaxID=41759 RepID=UPI003CCE14C1
MSGLAGVRLSGVIAEKALCLPNFSPSPKSVSVKFSRTLSALELLHSSSLHEFPGGVEVPRARPEFPSVSPSRNLALCQCRLCPESRGGLSSPQRETQPALSSPFRPGGEARGSTTPVVCP